MRRLLCGMLALGLLLCCNMTAAQEDPLTSRAAPTDTTALTGCEQTGSAMVTTISSSAAVGSDAVPETGSDGSGPEGSDAARPEGSRSDAACPEGSRPDGSLVYYAGAGLFQAGSLSGPQSVDTGARMRLFRLRATPAETLYADIVAAMALRSDGTITYTKNGSPHTASAIYVDLPQGGYTKAGGSFTPAYDAAYMVYAKAINDHPESFYCFPNVVFRLDAEDPAQANEVTGMYMLIDPDMAAQTPTYEAALQAALTAALPDPAGLCESEKALALHDYLVRHVRYHNEAADAGSYEAIYETPGYRQVFSAYGALVQGRAVCHGLSLAYKALAEAAGMRCYVVPSFTAGHAWNLVYADGAWYHVDVTLDGESFYPGYADPDHDGQFLGVVQHDYCLLSDDERAAKAKGSWVAADFPAAPRTHPYAAFWQGVHAAMYPMGGLWYYNDGGYSTADGRTYGNLRARAYGSATRAQRLFAGVSFPAFRADAMTFYDHADGKLYTYVPANGARYVRRAMTRVGELEYGPLSPGSGAVAAQRLYCVSGGAGTSFYDGADLGDVNADGTVNVLDALLAAGGGLDEARTVRADVDWNGRADSADADRICRYVTRLSGEVYAG